MRYTSKMCISDLRQQYDVLIGWGTAVMEFESRYNPTQYKLDYLINGKGSGVGNYSCGNLICDLSVLQEIKDKKVCVIIYSNKEVEIEEQVLRILSDADIIIGRLVEVPEVERTYSRDHEDRIMLSIVKKLGLSKFSYLDIGVCHPVVRNNTYLLYQEEESNGVLVEPNPMMAKLASEYRPQDRMLVCGASAGDEGELEYYEGNSPGLNTFSRELAERRDILKNVTIIPVKNINKIIEENFSEAPSILDIDTEGMDYELLSALDTEKYKIKIICAEAAKHSIVKNCLEEKGYVHYCTTIENQIFVRKEDLDKILP